MATAVAHVWPIAPRVEDPEADARDLQRQAEHVARGAVVAHAVRGGRARAVVLHGRFGRHPALGGAHGDRVVVRRRVDLVVERCALWQGAARQLSIVVLASAVGYGIGSLFGTAIA
jgi:hypothetical protein